MNSLEFIKQHVTEWPSTDQPQITNYVKLLRNGTVMFGESRGKNRMTCIIDVDLFEHFSPDYYDGKGWSREEFEACGKSTGIDATVEERGNRYGAFKDGADIMQELKGVMRSTRNWSNLTPSQREALEMIQHKVGRILNGDPNYTDSWHDIQGYARLIEEELNGNAK